MDLLPWLYGDPEDDTSSFSKHHVATAIEATVEAWQIAEEANGKQIENVVGAALRRGGRCKPLKATLDWETPELNLSAESTLWHLGKPPRELFRPLVFGDRGGSIPLKTPEHNLSPIESLSHVSYDHFRDSRLLEERLRAPFSSSFFGDCGGSIPLETPEPNLSAESTLSHLYDDDFRDIPLVEEPHRAPFFSSPFGDYGGSIPLLGNAAPGSSFPTRLQHSNHQLGGHPRLDFSRDTVRQRLANGYPSLEIALSMAVVNGKWLEVLKILQSARDFLDQSGISLLDDDAVSTQPIDWPDLGLQQMTCLMVAAQKDNPRMVRALLDYGVEVNVVTTRGSALSIAAELNAKQVIPLLLQRNADLTDAIFQLSTSAPFGYEDSPHTRKLQSKLLRAIKRLDKLSSETSIDQETPSDTLIRRLHFEFSWEYIQVLEAIERSKSRSSRSSQGLPNPGLFDQIFDYESDLPGAMYETVNQFPLAPPPDAFVDWTLGFERKRRTWTSGMRVVRGLMRGEVPERVNETLMFLMVVKAMSTVLDLHEGGTTNHRHRFLEGLPSWQRIFSSQNGTLGSFREAIRHTWGIALAEPVEESPVDSQTLQKFQETVEQLLASLQPILESRMGGRDGIESEGFLLNGLDLPGQPLDNPEFVLAENQEEELEFYNEDLSLVHQHPHKALDPLLVLLMSGTIFAALILFFIVFRTLVTDTRSRESVTPPSWLSVQEPVLRASLHHLLFVLQASLFLDLETVSKIRSMAEEVISFGLATTISSLLDYMVGYTRVSTIEPTTSKQVQSGLHSVKENWGSSYTLQEIHHLLQVYLCSPNIEIIVPPNIFPCSGDPHNTLKGHQFSKPVTYEPSFLHQYGNLNTPAGAEQDTVYQITLHSANSAMQSPLSPTPISPSSKSPPNTTPTSTISISTNTPTSNPDPHKKTFCTACSRLFTTLSNYNKHLRDKHEKVGFPCRIPGCGKTLSRKAYRETHEKGSHSKGVMGRAKGKDAARGRGAGLGVKIAPRGGGVGR